MTSLSSALKAIVREARPLIEQQVDLAEQVAALRDAATDKGLDWSQIKALLKAMIQDERDETGDGKRVQKIIDKAEHASAYAGMLGLAKMNEIIFSAEISPDPHTSAAADGQPGIPSDPAAGAKSDGGATPSSVGAGVTSDGHSREGSQAVTIPPSSEPFSSPAETKADDAPSLAASSADNFEPPAFLRERAYLLRPNCLKPDNCGSYGAKHCSSCERAARESEAA